jgi:uncharacterized protein (DUF2141 family)
MKAVLCLVLLAAAGVAQDAETRNVTGVVVDSITHQPLRNVRISANAIGPSVSQQRIPPAETDAQGAFAFRLKPGQYALTAIQPDYRGPFKMVTVDALEHADPVTMELVPNATVSGRVLDEDGDPMGGCTVAILPTSGTDRIFAGMQARGPGASSSVATGEYRIPSVPPGNYILTAECTAPPFQPRPLSAGPDPPPSLGYPLVFYPGVPDQVSAQTIELSPGAQTAGIDFQMRPAKVTQVRVTFSPPADDVTVRLVPLNGTCRRGFGVSEITCGSGPACEFRQVFADSYLVLAIAAGEQLHGGITRIEVKDRPMNVAVGMRPAVDISGGVEAESGVNRDKVHPDKTSIALTPDYPGFERGLNNLLAAGAPASDDGSFKLEGVLPVRWRVQANPSFGFVRSAWLGGTEILRNGMDLTAGVSGALRILLSGNTGTIRGTAPAGRAIVLGGLSRPPVQADSSGQFKFEGLAPGKYRLTVMLEEAGKEVTVQEGETVTVDLRN